VFGTKVVFIYQGHRVTVKVTGAKSFTIDCLQTWKLYFTTPQSIRTCLWHSDVVVGMQIYRAAFKGVCGFNPLKCWKNFLAT